MGTGGFGLINRVRQVFCGMSGHDEMLHFGPERIALKCASCGHESHGWDLNDTHPPVTARVEERRLLTRPQLIGARRIA